jgi:hypothetical protein
MAHDSTITDAWLNAPLDHGRDRHRAVAPDHSMRLVLVCVAGAIGILALAWAALEWRGIRDNVQRHGTPPTLPAPGQRPSAQPPRPEATAPRAPAPLEGRITRVTKCVSANGAPTTFSDGPCPPGTRSEVVAVRPDLNLADGMSGAARSESIRDSRIRAEASAEYERWVAAQVDSTSELCARLDAQIAALDAEARQPLPGWRQDEIRELRKKARDRQFALRCT